MSAKYQFNDEDRKVLQAAADLVRRLLWSGKVRPAQVVSVAKVQHVLLRLPGVTTNVNVTIELAERIKQDGFSSCSDWQFSVGEDWLNLSCSEIQYTKEAGSDWFTVFCIAKPTGCWRTWPTPRSMANARS
jgi:hypothetical protein